MGYTPKGQAVEVMNAEYCMAVKGDDARKVWVNGPARKVPWYDRGQFDLAFGLLRSGVAIGPSVQRHQCGSVAE